MTWSKGYIRSILVRAQERSYFLTLAGNSFGSPTLCQPLNNSSFCQQAMQVLSVEDLLQNVAQDFLNAETLHCALESGKQQHWVL